MSDLTERELNDILVRGIIEGRWIAVLVAGELRFIHTKHASDEQKKRALPVEDVRRLLTTREAE